MNELSVAAARRRQMRWFLLVAINVSRPVAPSTGSLVPIIQFTYPDATHAEIRKELDYLEARMLVTISRDPLDQWYVDLTREGIDMVEYTIDCEPGIARPKLTQA